VFDAIDLEKLVSQKDIGSPFEPYDWPSFQSFAFLNLYVLDFTQVAMLVIRVSNCTNLASMVLVWT
jgi:hypothetical protein